MFLGRATVTTYLYDDAGRLTHTTTASAWGPEDQALMMAWREYQDGLCSDCGHPKATAWDPTRGTWFERVDDIVCWACTAAKERNPDGSLDKARRPVVVDTYDPAFRPDIPND